MLKAHWGEIQLVETSYWTTVIWIREDSHRWKSSWHVNQGYVKREAKALCQVGRHELWLKTWVEDLLRSVLEGEIVGCTWHPFLPAHLPCQSSFMSLFQKSSKQAFSFIEKWPKHGEVWLLLMRSVARRVGHAETKKKKRKKTEAILPWVVSWSRNRELKETAIFDQFLCEFQRDQNTEKRELQLRGAIWRDREKHSERVREWKRKKRHFFFI